MSGATAGNKSGMEEQIFCRASVETLVMRPRAPAWVCHLTCKLSPFTRVENHTARLATGYNASKMAVATLSKTF